MVLLNICKHEKCTFCGKYAVLHNDDVRFYLNEVWTRVLRVCECERKPFARDGSRTGDVGNLVVRVVQPAQREPGQSGRASLDDPSESLARRAEQASAGGKMAVFASKHSRQRSVKAMWSPKTVRARKVGPLVGGMIAEAE